MVSKNMIKKIKYLLIPVFLGLVYLYQTQGELVFFPKKMDLPNRQAYSKYEIAVFRDKQILHGWFINNPSEQNLSNTSKKLIVIYGDGDQELSTLLPVSEKLGETSILMVNYRGYGESTGEPTQNSLIADALDTLDQICADTKIEYKDVTLYGHGLGTGIATVIAHYRDVGALVLSSPFDSMVSVINSKHPYLPVKFLLKYHFSSVTIAPGMELPTIVTVADSDDRYLPQHAQKLLSRWKGDVTEKHYPFNRYTILDEDNYWSDIKDFINAPHTETPVKPIKKQGFQKETKIVYASKLEDKGQE